MLFLGICPEIALLGNLVVLCLVSLGTAILFFTMTHMLSLPLFHVILLAALQGTCLNCFHFLVLQQPFLSSFFTSVNLLLGIDCHLIRNTPVFQWFLVFPQAWAVSCNLDPCLGQPVTLIPIFQIKKLIRWASLLWEWVGIAKDQLKSRLTVIDFHKSLSGLEKLVLKSISEFLLNTSFCVSRFFCML